MNLVRQLGPKRSLLAALLLAALWAICVVSWAQSGGSAESTEPSVQQALDREAQDRNSLDRNSLEAGKQAPRLDAPAPQAEAAPAKPAPQERRAVKPAQPTEGADNNSAALPPLKFDVPAGAGKSSNANAQVSDAVRVIVLLTVLSLGPGIIVTMTAFIRIIIVLSMLRHALGMPETPPNAVLVSLSLFLTAFVMLPVINKINSDAWQPFSKNQITVSEALDRGSEPLREFMLKQTRDADLKLMYEISNAEMPTRAEEVSLVQLVPAFVLNELRVAFQIGFVIFLPFLLIDLVVSSVLMALGMMMVPPATISLPLKVLLFVLIDGWALILRGVVGSFY